MQDSKMTMHRINSSRSPSPVQNVINYLSSWFPTTTSTLPINTSDIAIPSSSVKPIVADVEMGGIPPNCDYVAIPITYSKVVYTSRG